MTNFSNGISAANANRTESAIAVTGDGQNTRRIWRFASGRLRVSFSIPHEGKDVNELNEAVGSIAKGIGLALARNDNAPPEERV